MTNQLIHLAPLENKLMLTRVKQSKKINGAKKQFHFQQFQHSCISSLQVQQPVVTQN